jgi:hypothetical protein
MASPVASPALDPNDLRRLRAAAESYFRGDYSATRMLLRGVNWAAAKPPNEACILDAAAAYALSRAGGDETSEMLREAERVARGCRAGVAAAPLRGRLFSPAFLRFWQRARQLGG